MSDAKPADTIFLDRDEAIDAAGKGLRVPQTVAVSGRQICYLLTNESIAAVPDTVVPIHPDKIEEFFRTTHLRWPTRVKIPPYLQDHAIRSALTQRIKLALSRARRLRQQETGQLLERYRSRPAPTAGPLRVFAIASRLTTVMQYASRGLIEGFRQLGIDTRLSIESDDREQLDWLPHLTAAAEFDPHLVIDINHHNSRFYPEGVTNVVWWQDLMMPLRTSEQIPWRASDLVYVAQTHQLAAGVLATGLDPQRLRRRFFGIDAEVFHHNGADDRRNKVVFVGSSVLRGNTDAERRLTETLSHRIQAGELLSDDVVVRAGERYGLSRDESLQVRYACTRDHVVRWLCSLSGVEVEVYGRYWESDPVIAPFFRGELPHGKAVADVYRSAKYALVTHPHAVNTQRLAEAGACGCIPVVYDVREIAEGPHHEDLLLYFRTPEQLAEVVRYDRPTRPEFFSDLFSYRSFALQILKDAADLPSAPAIFGEYLHA